MFKDGASGWHLHPLRLIDRPGLPVPGGAAVRAAPVGLCSGIEAARICRRHCRLGASLRVLSPVASFLPPGAAPPGFRRGSLFSGGDGAAGFGGRGIIACSFALMGLGGIICRGMPQFGCGGGGCDRIRYMKVVLQRVSQASVDVVNELGDLDPTFDLQQSRSGVPAAGRRDR